MSGRNTYTYDLECGHTVSYGPPGARTGDKVICVRHEPETAVQRILGLATMTNSVAGAIDMSQFKSQSTTHCPKHAVAYIFQPSGKKRCKPCNAEARARHRAKQKEGDE